MKKIYTGVLLFCIAFASCKKDSKPATVNDKTLHKVTFTVSSFSQQHLAFQPNSITGSKSLNSITTTYPASSDTIDTYPVLIYQVYDSTGKLVHEIDQDTTTTNFGTINDQLTAGTYTIVLAGGINSDTRTEGSEKLTADNDENTLTTAFLEYLTYTDPYVGNPSSFFNETFYKKFTLTVTTGSVAQNVTLPHIVAQVIVNIQDAIPANVTSIGVSFSGQPIYFDLSTGLPDMTSVYTGASTPGKMAVVPGTVNYRSYTYIINTVEPCFVTITAYNGSAVIASKTTQNITCVANERITLTGNLFGGTSGNSTGGGTISLNADTAWNTTTLNYHF